MLFPYQYVSHPLEKLHSWMEHLVTQVWCRKEGRYSVALLCPELQTIADEINSIETKKRSIFDDIRDIDALIQALAQDKRDELITMFRDSTAVDDLCCGKGNVNPFCYADLKSWDENSAIKLKEFFYNLFDEHIKWGPIKRKLGDLKAHVDQFCGTNTEAMCPFCGLTDMRDEKHTTREDYDHYLPRSKYPFNSVNFRNLAPMCGLCNSGYKGQKDPISGEAGARQRAYSPFDPKVNFPQISIQLDADKLQTLEKGDILMTFKSDSHQEEVDTWQWLFGIQERYKAKLCQKRGVRTWLKMVLKDSKLNKLDPLDVLQRIRDNAAEDPFVDDGFLKVAALDACDVAKLSQQDTKLTASGYSQVH